MKGYLLALVIACAGLVSCIYNDPFGGTWRFDRELIEDMFGPDGCYDGLETLAARNLEALRQANQNGDRETAELAERNLEEIDQEKQRYESTRTISNA